MTAEQKQAVLDRDFQRCSTLGGNVYFLSKIFATDGLSYVQAVSTMTGMTVEEYPAMMLAGGRSPKAGARRRNGAKNNGTHHRRHRDQPRARPSARRSTWARPRRTTGSRCSPGTSGPQVGRGPTMPDVVILVYNDHARAFDLDIMPTFALGCAEEFEPADEGWGPRPVPVGEGHPELPAHLAAVAHPRRVRHDAHERDGRRPRPDRAAVADVRQARGSGRARVIPLAVNVVAVSRRRRASAAGSSAQAIRRCGGELPRGPQRAGLGHRRHEPPAPGRARRADQPGIRQRVPGQAGRTSPTSCGKHPALEFLREAGSEGIEMIMWLIMRGALGDKVEELHRFYHVPASNTAVGHLILPLEGERMTVNIAVVGLGAFGHKHLDALTQILDAKIQYVAHSKMDIAKEVAAKYGAKSCTYWFIMWRKRSYT